MPPSIPVLELSALNSRESGGDLNVKSDDRQQKKASPIGKWDFAPSEEKKAVKRAKEDADVDCDLDIIWGPLGLSRGLENHALA